MSVTYRILTHLNLVFVRYRGTATAEESRQTFDAYSRDPAFHPSHRHLVDTAQVTEVARNFPELMRLQARIAESLGVPPSESLIVYHAPHQAGRIMARFVAQSWSAVPEVVVREAATEAQALSILGIEADTFAAILGEVHEPKP